jgi:DNA-binding response OmpR family regulator
MVAEEVTRPQSIICPCCLQFVEGLEVLADPTSCRIAVEGKTVTMKRQPFKLAKYLLDRYPLMATKDQIYHAVYMNERGDGPEIKIIDVTIATLRPIMQELGFAIETIWGRGYKLVKASPEEIPNINKTFRGGRSKP